MYAQVVFNLPIPGPFDYSIPSSCKQDPAAGMRVEVSFGRRRCIGYVVGRAKDTQAKKIKPILRILDRAAILDKTMLRITRKTADYYACSWGEAIEAAVPVSLRRSRKMELAEAGRFHKAQSKKAQVFLLQGLDEQERWDILLEKIKESIDSGKGVIFLTPDKEQVKLIQNKIKERLNLEVGLFHSSQSAREELEQWTGLRSGRLKIVVGTRRAIFAPISNLGLVIIEEEQSPVYKQDSVPHYNAVGVARIRAELEGAEVILSSRSPSLEAWHEATRAKNKGIKYISENTGIPARQIKIIDLHRVGFIPGRKKMRLSVSLEDAINHTLNQKGRVVLFLNRRGFAIFASCHDCGKVLRCPRCNTNLILHFKDNKLFCHRCNYKTQSPRICPACNSGYIRYSGLGTEKLESEISRLYPQAVIARLDKDKQIISRDAQIIIATESLFRHPPANPDLIGVISVDSILNLPDFRAAERVFALLLHLASLTDNSLIVQTNFPEHHCFQALRDKNIDFFYQRELALRRESNLPPFNHIIMVKLRGRKEEQVSLAAEELFNILKKSNKDRTTKIVSFSSGIPNKKRDNFYEQILIKVKSVSRTVSFLKKTLGSFRRSGIIVTVDVDPV